MAARPQARDQVAQVVRFGPVPVPAQLDRRGLLPEAGLRRLARGRYRQAEPGRLLAEHRRHGRVAGHLEDEPRDVVADSGALVVGDKNLARGKLELTVEDGPARDEYR